MENITYQDLCRIFGQMTLEYRIQIEKLKQENLDLLKLVKDLQDDSSRRSQS